MKRYKKNNFLIAFVKITGWLFSVVFYKTKKYYADGAKKKLPKACILMSNHTSLMDFPLYLFSFPFRNIRFLMAEVLFAKSKLFSWFLYSLGGIFVDRDAFDFSFVGESLEALEKGQTVGIFPQGRLPLNGKQFPFKPGITYIALHCNRPIIPVYTDGNYGFFKRAKVVIGESIYIKEMCDTENPSEEKLAELTAYLEKKTFELKKYIGKKKKKERKRARLFDLKKIPMDAARLICFSLLPFFRMKRYNTQGTPYKRPTMKGPGLAVINHTGFLDPFFIFACFWYRRMYFMASEELMAPKVRSFFMRGAGCIKVDRNICDITAIRKSVKVLAEEKRMLAIFPQGQIVREAGVEQVKSGAVLIALKSGAPIIPVYIPKTPKFLSKKTAIIGDPIICSDHVKGKIPSMEDISKITDLMLEEMIKCQSTYEKISKEKHNGKS